MCGNCSEPCPQALVGISYRTFLAHLLLFSKVFHIYVYRCFAHTFVCHLCAWCLWRSEVFNLLEPELHMVVRLHVGAGNQTHSFCKSF